MAELVQHSRKMVTVQCESEPLSGCVRRFWRGDIYIMISNAKNETILLGSTTMDYITFGTGKKTLVIIPGLGDGLKNVKGMAVPFSVLYKTYAKEYTVYMFSRKNKLEPDCSTRSMAFDLMVAMEILGIWKADLIGISQGGMIAQHFALRYPERVGKMVLAVTSARPNPCLTEVISGWMHMAERGEYEKLIFDQAYKMYTKGFIEKNKWLLPAVSHFGKPESFERYQIMAQACLEHDCYEQLEQIHTPTLVAGAGEDQVLGVQASIEIAEKIPDSRLQIYEDYGHGVYLQSRTFHEAVLGFLTGQA